MKEMIFLIILLFSCNFEQNYVDLKIKNKSDFTIDSIIIHSKLYDNFSKENILKYRIYKEPKTSEGGAIVFIYSNNKKFVTSCCTWDWHQFQNEEETLYLFNNGISYDSVIIKKPELFYIYVGFRNGEKIDSVYGNFIHKKYYKNIDHINVYYDYDSIAADPYIFTVSNNQVTKYLIENDWENWNNDQILISSVNELKKVD